MCAKLQQSQRKELGVEPAIWGHQNKILQGSQLTLRSNNQNSLTKDVKIEMLKGSVTAREPYAGAYKMSQDCIPT